MRAEWTLALWVLKLFVCETLRVLGNFWQTVCITNKSKHCHCGVKVKLFFTFENSLPCHRFWPCHIRAWLRPHEGMIILCCAPSHLYKVRKTQTQILKSSPQTSRDILSSVTISSPWRCPPSPWSWALGLQWGCSGRWRGLPVGMSGGCRWTPPERSCAVRGRWLRPLRGSPCWAQEINPDDETTCHAGDGRQQLPQDGLWYDRKLHQGVLQTLFFLYVVCSSLLRTYWPRLTYFQID